MSEEQEQFEELFRATRGPLLGYLSRRAPADNAADLLAEVYLVAWRRRAELPPGEARRPWLFGVARRLVAEHHRCAGRRAEAEGSASDLGGQTGGDGTCLLTSGPDDLADRADAVRRALGSLSDLDRELVTLTTWEGLSSAEAARAVGITSGTARVRLHRARARLARHPSLRALLTDDDAEGASPDTTVPSTTAIPAC